jgi:rare lipoprotein A (peptidoglycan hydrolase)
MLEASPVRVDTSRPRPQGGDSWYGPGLYGRTMASDESCSRHERLASYHTLPLATQVVVTTIDRGFYVDPPHRMDVD